MAGITLAQAQAQLNAYLAAETAILSGAQSYTAPEGDAFTKADLGKIQQGIEIWNRRVKRLSRGGMAIRGAVINHVK
jgi:hypothetical protein